MDLKLAAVAAAITISTSAIPVRAESQPLPGPPTPVEAVTLAAIGDSPASGSAWIITGPDEQHVIVTAVVRGLQPGSSQSAQLRGGTCQSASGPAYPLNDIVANDEGIATASTVLAVGLQSITPGSFALDLGPGGSGIACGNVTADSVQMIGNQLQFQQLMMDQMQQMFQNAPPGLLNP